MAFGISTRNTQAIRDFNQAEHLFNTTKEVRGKNKYTVGVPLQYSRRDWRHKALVKVSDDAYAAKLYETNVITWHRDGGVEVNMSYGSVSTDTFANYFLHASRFRCNIHSNHSVLSGYVGAFSKPIRDRVWAENDMAWPKSEWCQFVSKRMDKIMLRKDSEGHVLFEFDDIAQVGSTYVDKSKAAELRKPFEPLFDYLKIFEAYPMSDVDEFASVLTTNRVLREVVDAPDNDALWADLAAAYHANSYGYINGVFGRKLRFAGVAAIKKDLYPLLYKKAGATFIKPLPFGVLRDRWVRV